MISSCLALSKKIMFIDSSTSILATTAVSSVSAGLPTANTYSQAAKTTSYPSGQ
jgi:hypothetical protein